VEVWGNLKSGMSYGAIQINMILPTEGGRRLCDVFGRFEMRLIRTVSWPARPAGFHTWIRFSHEAKRTKRQGVRASCKSSGQVRVQ